MVGRVLVIIITLFALFMGLMACILPANRLEELLVYIKLFEVMLPILGVGALIKYMFDK
jgi:hypothetical protein